ncbi:hypothetical protein LUZ60_014995 [Juncus effusus]|nr:hypothetical protein LUZ60_014995 [Juncus effusus]
MGIRDITPISKRESISLPFQFTPGSMDPLKLQRLNLTANPDGSFTHLSAPPLSPAFPEGETLPSCPVPVRSKDVPLNPSNNTSIRLFLPSLPPSETKPLPLIIFFHGGGFVLFNAATAPLHVACAELAASVPAIVASVDYRLAPQHRLPAAFEDAHDALIWAKSAFSSESEPWIKNHGDPTKLFLMGSSCGGTICYHAALNVISSDLDLSPVRLAGLILDQPYFGGVERTKSELEFHDDKIISLPTNDIMWEMALPLGSDRDHEYSNVMLHEAKETKLLPPCLVRGHVGDPLYDRQKLFVEMLQRAGVSVVAEIERAGHHGIELFEPEKAAEMADDVRSFVYGHEDGSVV